MHYTGMRDMCTNVHVYKALNAWPFLSTLVALHAMSPCDGRWVVDSSQ